MNPRRHFHRFWLILAASAAMPAAVTAAPRPNFLLIVADDLGCGDISTLQASDVFPTFLEAAGTKPPADLDAVSLMPILRGGSSETARDLYFVRREGGAAYGGKSYEALIRGEWKLLQNDPYSALELYNLRDDPPEQQNLASTKPDKVRELTAALRVHLQRGGAVPWQPPREK